MRIVFFNENPTLCMFVLSPWVQLEQLYIFVKYIVSVQLRHPNVDVFFFLLSFSKPLPLKDFKSSKEMETKTPQVGPHLLVYMFQQPQC